MPLLEVEKLVNKYYVNKYLDFALKILYDNNRST